MASADFNFTVFTGDEVIIKSLKDSPVRVLKRRGVEHFNSFGDFLMFTIFSPFIWIYVFTRLINLRIKKHKVLILASLPEKLLITPWARIIGYKVFWLESNFLPNNFKINIYSAFYKLWSNFATIIAASESVKDQLTKIYRINERNIKLIPQALPQTTNQGEIFETLAHREFERKNEALFVIGYVGELTSENGLEYLIKAIEHFKDFIPQYQIIMVGDGSEKKNLIWLTKMMKLDHQVRFVGQQDNVSKWYPYFDILVLPRLKETNFCVIAAESMAAGTPVVASNVPGIAEVVNNQGGILVEPKNTEALATAIFTLYHDKKLRHQFSLQAKARVANYYNFEGMIEKWKELLK
jgi:glycosyltransferase involved in cell wall biosynthesis